MTSEAKQARLLLENAVDESLTRDKWLYCQNTSGIERMLAFRIGVYLYNLAKADVLLQDYDVDMEYNRHGTKTKRIAENQKIQPDLLIHKRGTDSFNLLAVELKFNKTASNDDINKLKALTNTQENYRYQLGIFVSLSKKPEFRLFVNGEKSDD